jgi:hypothetical protein
MFRIALAAVVLGSCTFDVSAAAQLPRRGKVFTGLIKDVRGTMGSLTLTMGKGKQTKDRTFKIPEARIVGPTGSEWKVGDLRKGDRVEVELTADGSTVREIRVLPDPAKSKLPPED